MIGHKLGEFSPTRTFRGHAADRKAKKSARGDIMESTAKLRFARISAQKARLVADLVRGRDVSEAIEIGSRSPAKKSAPIIRKLVESAVANAEQVKMTRTSMSTTSTSRRSTVDAGPSLRRFRPRAQGRATKILKKTSHITVVLGHPVRQMGQKVHPVGFRVGVTRGWDSNWFAEKDYGRFLEEDLAHPQARQEEAAQRWCGASIVIERAANKAKVFVHAAKPGIILGKRHHRSGGSPSTSSARLTSTEVYVTVMEVRKV